MSIGRGATGLLSGLRRFADLIDQSAARRQPVFDLAPGFEMPGSWVANGGAYGQRAHFVFNYRLLDVVGVETMVDPRPLVRVETLGLCQGNAGTYFYDPDAPTLPPGFWWDDGHTQWGDPGVTWGASTTYVEGTLYVHLPDNSNPANTTVMALLGFTVAGEGQVLPVIGGNKLTNPSADTWLSSTDLSGWSETSNVSQDVPLVGSGYSVRISGTIASGGPVGISQSTVGVKDAHYIFSGLYRTDPANPAAITARARVQNTAGVYLRLDGREIDGASEGHVLANTNGEIRRFVFVFRCPAATTTMEVLAGAYNASGAADAVIHFDDLHLHRVWGYRYYEPRLSESSLPETEVAAPGIFFGERTVGLGSASIINADGAWDLAFGGLEWSNKPALVSVGGAFQDGEELTRDDYHTAFLGTIQRPEWDRLATRLEMEDANTFLRVQCPARTYSLKDLPNMFLNQEGYRRPYFWGLSFQIGESATIHPVRTDRSASTLYGTYEVCDPAIAVNGIVGIGAKAYPTEEDARNGTRGYGIGAYITIDLATASFVVNDDVRNYQYDLAGNDVGTGAAFDFDIGGAALVALVNVSGPASLVASDLQAAMRAAAGGGGADITVVTSHTAHKFTTGKGAGTLNLLMKTGVNAHLRSWEILGHDLDIDRTGALSYVGDNATFTDPEVNHILRASGTGYKDDSGGTITGNANANIDTPAQVATHLLLKVAKLPVSRLDLPSFRFNPGDGGAGFTANPTLRMWLSEAGTLAEALSTLERSSFSHIVVDGEGVVHFRPHATAQVVAEFFDRDYLGPGLVIGRDSQNVFRAVRVLYGIVPKLGQYRSREDTAPESAGVPVRKGREDVLEIKTQIQESQFVEDLGLRYARLAAADPLIATFQAKSKLVGLLIGDIVELTSARAMTPTGRLEAAKFRIRRLRHNYLSGVSTCTAVEDVPFLFST